MIRTKSRLYVINICFVFAVLACQPVIAIGWREGLFIFILIAILIGPPVYRFIRRIENLKRDKSHKTDGDILKTK